MNLGEIARVSRGIAPRNRGLLIMTRQEAEERGLEAFVKPIIDGAREIPKQRHTVLEDKPSRLVMLIATQDDASNHPALRNYLGKMLFSLRQAASAPIVATYVGIPRFAANPHGLIALNSLYRVLPHKPLPNSGIMQLLERLNMAAERLPKSASHERFSPKQLESLEL